MEEVHVGRPVPVSGITIIPLEKVTVSHSNKKGRLSVYVSKEPVGVVVSSPQRKWAIDISGTQMPLETYIQEIHELQQVLDSL